MPAARRDVLIRHAAGALVEAIERRDGVAATFAILAAQRLYRDLSPAADEAAVEYFVDKIAAAAKLIRRVQRMRGVAP
jgi:hypothetical protein